MNSKIFLVGLLSLTVASAACVRNSTSPGYQIDMLTDMQEPVPYEAFEPNPNFANGQTLQQPPKGTVPRGMIPYMYEASDAGWQKAGAELKNPIASDKNALARGQFVYETFCLHCHGPTGQGDGQLIPRYPNPPSFTTARVLEQADGNLYHTITVGLRNMPPHGSQIEPNDRWKLIHYIRQLQNKTM